MFSLSNIHSRGFGWSDPAWAQREGDGTRCVYSVSLFFLYMDALSLLSGISNIVSGSASINSELWVGYASANHSIPNSIGYSETYTLNSKTFPSTVKWAAIHLYNGSMMNQTMALYSLNATSIDIILRSCDQHVSKAYIDPICTSEAQSTSSGSTFGYRYVNIQFSGNTLSIIEVTSRTNDSSSGTYKFPQFIGTFCILVGYDS